MFHINSATINRHKSTNIRTYSHRRTGMCISSVVNEITHRIGDKHCNLHFAMHTFPAKHTSNSCTILDTDRPLWLIASRWLVLLWWLVALSLALAKANPLCLDMTATMRNSAYHDMMTQVDEYANRKKTPARVFTQADMPRNICMSYVYVTIEITNKNRI